ncbi:MAG: TetR/AcrR family transcriptional regulator [Spirochaetales bacterium]|nr:TetR/AcrR family transcriptional regulator [Spirochaetales bacterium]
MRADKQRNKEKILKIAEEILTRNNIDTIAIDEIARAAEVTRATLYNHFSSKEELLKEMVLPALKEITEDLKEKNSSGKGDFSSVTASLFKLYINHQKTLELVSCRTLYGNEDVTASHKAFMEEFNKAMILADAEHFPLGMEMSLKLISATYLSVLSELQKAGKLTYSLFHKIMEGVLTL